MIKMWHDLLCSNIYTVVFIRLLTACQTDNAILKGTVFRNIMHNIIHVYYCSVMSHMNATDSLLDHNIKWRNLMYT